MSSQPAPSLIDLSSALAERLAHLEASPVEVVAIEPLVGDRAPTELKRMGYGVPLLVRYRSAGSLRQVVFRTQAPNWFGHDRRHVHAFCSDGHNSATSASSPVARQCCHAAAIQYGVVSAW